MDKAEVHELNPLALRTASSLIHAFTDGNNSCMGIAENSPDNFAVIVRTRNENTTRSALWNIDLTSAEPKTTKIVDNITAGFNGLAKLAPDVMIATDTPSGDLWHIDLKTRTATVAHKSVIGVNGIRVRGKYIYFSNIRNGTFLRLPIDPVNGLTTGPSEIIARPGLGIDDFALSPFSDEAFVVNQQQDQVVRVSLNGNSKVDAVAGSLNSSTISAPTSAQFGRTSQDSRTLYVTTSGKRPGNGKSADATRIGGKIIALKL
jgi:sugar lactone lactonase YvrE